MTPSPWTPDKLGVETRKSHARRTREGFFDRYFRGLVLDIGYRGYEGEDAVPVLPGAVGVDLDYPGYDGRRLPFEDGTVDTIYTSHTLEHIPEPEEALRDWFRALRPGGFLVIAVPHQHLYERRTMIPSRWNPDHKRFYTPAGLLAEVERALPPNTYRIRHLVDDDEGYHYEVPPLVHAVGAFQIELVLEKIPPPDWVLEGPEVITAERADAYRDALQDLETNLYTLLTDITHSADYLSREQAQLALRLHELRGRILQGPGAGAPPDPGTWAGTLGEAVGLLTDLSEHAKVLAEYAKGILAK